MSDVVKTFRSQMYGDVYRFRYRYEAGNWNVYIEEHPPNPFGGDCTATHILAGNKLCVVAPAPELKDAVAHSLYWIGYFSNYVRTGQTMQSDARVHVDDRSVENV